MTEKVDFKKTLDSYRARRGEFRVLEVPPMRYVMVDGVGDPNTSPAFTEALESIYPVAYKLKLASKTELGRDYVVPPLEALWWAEDARVFTTARDKSKWSWTVMLMVPDWIETDMVNAMIARVAEQRSPDAGSVVRVEELEEGLCVQTLHLGSFDDEGPTLEQMHEREIPGRGLQMRGTHHEIYFSDVRRVAPERQRTILRQPVGLAEHGSV